MSSESTIEDLKGRLPSASNNMGASRLAPYGDMADEMLTADISRVLVIYTGGTIGMKNLDGKGYCPVAEYLPGLLKQMTMFHDPDHFAELDPERCTNNVHLTLKYPGQEVDSITLKEQSGIINGTPYKKIKKPSLITPCSFYGKRTRYSILEYEPLLDSSNMTMSDWIKIATDIEINYALFDAFVVLHGTDTMCYTASALSFLLEDLGKTVILTNSCNSAIDNLLGALTIAGHFVIPEVGLFFAHKLFRGNRTSKVDVVDFEAFQSPNLSPLVSVGIDINVNWPNGIHNRNNNTVFRPFNIARFRAHKTLNSSVAVLRIFPGITRETVEAFLAPPVRGVVLQTYGAGNVPNNRPDLLNAFRAACDRDVVIVNCSQCPKGMVSEAYATGKVLYELGIVSGSDMTPECALVKLSYLLGKEYQSKKCRLLMSQSIRGELTLPSKRDRFTYHFSNHRVVNNLWNVFNSETLNASLSNARTGNSTMSAEADYATVHLMLCHAVRSGDIGLIRNCSVILGALQAILSEHGNMVNDLDTDSTPLINIACRVGNAGVVELLLNHGASIHLRDYQGHGPLWEALRSRNMDIIQLLRRGGAHFSEENKDETTHLLITAVTNNDMKLIELLYLCDVDFNHPTFDRRTALHIAVSANHIPIVKFIVDTALSLTRFREVIHHIYFQNIPQSITRSHSVESTDIPLASRMFIDLEPIDIFHNTPLDNAITLKYSSIADILRRGILGQSRGEPESRLNK